METAGERAHVRAIGSMHSGSAAAAEERSPPLLEVMSGASAEYGDERSTPLPAQAGHILVIERPEEIRVAWAGLAALEATGFARHAITGRYLGPVRLTNDGTLLSAGHNAEAPLRVQLDGYAVTYRFLWDPRGAGLPRALHCEAVRKERRARVSRRVKLAFLLPEHGEKIAEFSLRDVSHSGVGLECEASMELVHLDQKLEELTIRWKGGDVLRGRARVAHISKNPVTGLERCGLLLDFSAATRERWHALVDGVLNPRSVQGQPEPRALWEAYVDSGYLNLSGKAPSDFESELEEFKLSQSRLRRAPSVGAFFAAGDNKRLEAFGHQLQVWDKSWVWYHLCRLRTGRSLQTSDDHVLVDLYSRAYDYVRQQGAKWLVTYIQKDAGYSRLVHHESAKQLESCGASCVVPFQVHEVCGLEASSALGCEVASASPDQAEAVRAFVETQYPALYLQATGLAEPGLGLQALTELWAAHGLEREREVLVVTNGEHVLASAVLESASPGLHLYGLLDCARVFAHVADAEPFVAALLFAAQEWYRERGRSRFCYFRNPLHDPVEQRPGSRSLGEAYVTVHTAEAIPQLLERVFVLAAPNSPRTRRKHHADSH